MDEAAAREIVAQEVRLARAMAEVYRPRMPSTILPKPKTSLYRFAAGHIDAERAIDYLEFGVAEGHSMRLMASIFMNPKCRFYGFDSFVGLPEKWLMHGIGAFSTCGRAPVTQDDRIGFIKGWFQNSVPKFLARFKRDEARPILIHFDADLYSSTLFLLTSLWHAVGEYYFICDDFIYDESVAIHDFMKAYPVEIEFFAQTRGGGEPPNSDQVFGHMKRVPFVLRK